MESWIARVDFCRLEVLRLGQMVSPAALHSLVGCTEFPFMTNLRFTCDERPGMGYYLTVKGFIRRLPLLVNLDILAWDFGASTLAYALSPKLTNLYLRADLDVALGGVPGIEEITGIVQRCQKLVELWIPLRRSRGDADEVAKYKTLGRLPCLSRLRLFWDVSFPPPSRNDPDGALDTIIEPHFDEFDKVYAIEHEAWSPPSAWIYPQGHIRDQLLNLAIDVKRALAVFHAVSSGKGRNSLPLQFLWTSTLCPGYRQETFGADRTVFTFGVRLGPERGDFNVSRNEKDGHRHELEVSTNRHELWNPGQGRSVNPLNPFMIIFRRLWPEKTHSAGWKHRPESKPLSGYGERWGEPLDEWAVMREELPSRDSA